jgi:membrane-bound lytic murein transglycosylase B
MNMDQINQALSDLANCGDPAFAQAAQNIQQATQAAQAGQFSTQDLAELLKDTQRQLDVVQEMSQLQFKETLNTVISGLLTIIGAVY